MYTNSATMVFVLGVNFAEAKLVKKALESFYGLGPQLSERIMAKYSIHKLAKMGSLAPRTITSLTAELGQMPIESDARKTLQDNIKRLKDMGTYRGRRHAMGLPVRGQRTRNQTATANKLNRINRTG
ncbi:30S ribosomal protein S13 [Cordyceps militaris CM01]|uniref:30S ribosomal protein S13 n=2 Tax=Cordyceps militaris TaxID=73501 RepID=G3JD64_CORMM|nr:30S ribosomal protein S13 [Cordyceps militaris CM01]EGX92539.1 30S ribosomal protein S13 [Cordyceps militaris CM01]